MTKKKSVRKQKARTKLRELPLEDRMEKTRELANKYLLGILNTTGKYLEREGGSVDDYIYTMMLISECIVPAVYKQAELGGALGQHHIEALDGYLEAVEENVKRIKDTLKAESFEYETYIPPTHH